MGDFFHAHAHSHYSARDGMSTVAEMVETVVAHDQPALALTDHGLMGGTMKLYKECKKAGIAAFPGEEFYLVQSVDDDEAKKARYHVGLLAITERGYEKLVRLSSRSHTRERYHRFPLIDWTDLKDLDAQGDIVLTTGCYFGLVAQTLIHKGVPQAVAVAKAYAKLVPNTYVEIQHHHTVHTEALGWDDTRLAIKLYEVAEKAGLPVIVTQDAHYCNEDEKKAHNMMKALTMHGAEPGEFEFPGDSYHLAETSWVKGHYSSSRTLRRIWNDSLASCRELMGLYDVRIPVLDTYSFRVPDLGYKNPDRALTDYCVKALAELDIPQRKRKRYEERLAYELGIIKDVGFSDYFLMGRRLIEFCRDNDYMVRARGSAAGALVCYLLDITDVDPVLMKLSFDRFLTRERTKPPDIDFDIEDEARPAIIEWLRNEIASVVQIGTYTTLGYDERTDRGSIVDDYVRMKKRISGKWAGNVMADIDPDDQKTLMKLSSMTIRRSAGAHAAGFLLGTSEHPIERYIPTMLIPSSNNTVTQVEMGDCEDAGYVKLDVLGLRYLSTLKECLRLLRENGIEYGWRGEKIPYDDTDTMAMLRGRKTEAVFQLEGGTASRGCRELRAKKTTDLILIMALYRPAALEPTGGGHGPSYCETFLRNRERPDRVRYRHPIIEKHLKETFGVSVFQEQVLAIMGELGMSVEELNKILKALKMSNKQSTVAAQMFHDAQAEFQETCATAGLDPATTDYVWDLVEGFAKYGFNRAHATSYGVLSYRLAYLKAQYPTEYMAATLRSTALKTELQPRYMKEARRMGLRITPPDVNRSGANWRVEHSPRGDALRRGLMSVKGVGFGAAALIEEHQPYDTIEELIERTGGRLVTGGREYAKEGTLKGVLETLRQAGALRSLGLEKD